jgi:UDP-N-acetylmuramyl tripeptide synthase
VVGEFNASNLLVVLGGCAPLGVPLATRPPPWPR